MSEHNLPWAYRPRKFDDWGWIRDASGDLAACARGEKGGKLHDDHRRDGTDPYGEYAALIVKAVNSHEALLKALERAKAAMLRTRAASIAGCEEGYGRPEKWADELFRSHGDLTASIKTIDGLLASVGTVGKGTE